MRDATVGMLAGTLVDQEHWPERGTSAARSKIVVPRSRSPAPAGAQGDDSIVELAGRVDI
jgi:hypothetical protein